MSVQVFTSGATRDSDESKYDYEGFLSPLVLERFGEYMHRHRLQTDGTTRSSDNWQKGIPKTKYMKSLVRHALDAWSWHRGHKSLPIMEDALCAIIFNAQGYLHEMLRRAQGGKAVEVLSLDNPVRWEQRKIRVPIKSRKPGTVFVHPDPRTYRY